MPLQLLRPVVHGAFADTAPIPYASGERSERAIPGERDEDLRDCRIVTRDQAATDAAGRFSLHSPEPGGFLLVGSALGYRERTAGVFELGTEAR